MMQPPFHQSQLDEYARTMQKIIRDYLENLKIGQKVSANEEMMRLTFEIVAQLLFSTDIDKYAKGALCSSTPRYGGQCPPYILFPVSTNSTHPATISLAASGFASWRLAASMFAKYSGAVRNWFILPAKASAVKSLFLGVAEQ